MLAGVFIFLTLGVIEGQEGVSRCRNEVGRQCGRGRIKNEIAAPAVNLSEIEAIELGEEFLLPGGIEAAPEGQEMFLAIFF